MHWRWPASCSASSAERAERGVHVDADAPGPSGRPAGRARASSRPGPQPASRQRAPRSEPDLVEHPPGGRLPHARLRAEALVLLVRVAQDVAVLVDLGLNGAHRGLPAWSPWRRSWPRAAQRASWRGPRSFADWTPPPGGRTVASMRGVLLHRDAELAARPAARRRTGERGPGDRRGGPAGIGKSSLLGRRRRSAEAQDVARAASVRRPARAATPRGASPASSSPRFSG